MRRDKGGRSLVVGIRKKLSLTLLPRAKPNLLYFRGKGGDEAPWWEVLLRTRGEAFKMYNRDTRIDIQGFIQGKMWWRGDR